MLLKNEVLPDYILLLRDIKNISSWHNTLNNVHSKNLVLHEKQFCAKKKFCVGQKVFWCRKNKFMLHEKSVPCHKKSYCCTKIVFRVDKNNMMLHKKKKIVLKKFILFFEERRIILIWISCMYVLSKLGKTDVYIKVKFKAPAIKWLKNA